MLFYLKIFVFLNLFRDKLVNGVTWNIALGKPVQSTSATTLPGMVVSSLVDGDPATCFRTNENPSSEARFTIDLGGTETVFAIGFRTSSLNLLLNYRIEVVNVITTLTAICYYEPGIAQISTHYIHICPPETIGRIVFIKLINQDTTGILTLCEVEVFARPVKNDVYCRESDLLITDAPFLNTPMMSSNVGCSVMCRQTGCETFSAQKQNAVKVCLLYKEKRFIVSDNQTSSFYFKC